MTGMGGMFDLVKNAGKMVEKAREIQAGLAKRTAEGTAGAGMVTARVNGLGELVGLELDKTVVNPDDIEMLASLVVAAAADAGKKAAALRAEAVRELAGGVDPSAFGLAFPGL